MSTTDTLRKETRKETRREALQRQSWKHVKDVIPKTKAIAFDGCHKIYLLLDQTAVDYLDSSQYDILEPTYNNVRLAYNQSCGLRFVQSIEDAAAAAVANAVIDDHHAADSSADTDADTSTSDPANISAEIKLSPIHIEELVAQGF